MFEAGTPLHTQIQKFVFDLEIMLQFWNFEMDGTIRVDNLAVNSYYHREECCRTWAMQEYADVSGYPYQDDVSVRDETVQSSQDDVTNPLAGYAQYLTVHFTTDDADVITELNTLIQDFAATHDDDVSHVNFYTLSPELTRLNVIDDVIQIGLWYTTVLTAFLILTYVTMTSFTMLHLSSIALVLMTSSSWSIVLLYGMVRYNDDVIVTSLQLMTAMGLHLTLVLYGTVPLLTSYRLQTASSVTSSLVPGIVCVGSMIVYDDVSSIRNFALVLLIVLMTSSFCVWSLVPQMIFMVDMMTSSSIGVTSSTLPCTEDLVEAGTVSVMTSSSIRYRLMTSSSRRIIGFCAYAAFMVPFSYLGYFSYSGYNTSLRGTMQDRGILDDVIHTYGLEAKLARYWIYIEGSDDDVIDIDQVMSPEYWNTLQSLTYDICQVYTDEYSHDDVTLEMSGIAYLNHTSVRYAEYITAMTSSANTERARTLRWLSEAYNVRVRNDDVSRSVLGTSLYLTPKHAFDASELVALRDVIHENRDTIYLLSPAGIEYDTRVALIASYPVVLALYLIANFAWPSSVPLKVRICSSVTFLLQCLGTAGMLNLVLGDVTANTGTYYMVPFAGALILLVHTLHTDDAIMTSYPYNDVTHGITQYLWCTVGLALCYTTVVVLSDVTMTSQLGIYVCLGVTVFGTIRYILMTSLISMMTTEYLIYGSGSDDVMSPMTYRSRDCSRVDII